MFMMIIENFYKARPPRIYEKYSPSIRADRKGLLVLVSQRSTNTPSQSTNTIIKITKTMETLPKSTGKQYQALTLLSEEARVKTSAWLESKKDSLEQGVDYSLSSSGVLKKSNLQILSGKMLKELYQAVSDGTLPECKLSSPKLAMIVNGKFSTPKTSESPKIVRESSLSDILEENPDPKYFLSKIQLEAIMSRDKNHENKLVTHSGQVMEINEVTRHTLKKEYKYAD